ncbi:50S ribosomal protein L29 [Gluconobacter wancherniae]|uniref:Large ribosomal subunit protein uL29 n=1 Tax=Gluconobacter wancherniae NBRC 103581 TaxID=656744 RepID=A0A511B3Y3_9PROT|nr:50S ribosomal protein L29 [Gluconobacter wancherniae]MBF0853946.1 50S ribosomal protein L29 [Gluconobacter wancherniae]MBS1062332.1 50S ribosomal protein L29 [Gluconobacter wancherniae]MBS1089206.1 50S ribosomal protein L29 [Gluconobacter wancherniae]MBS1094374.1 50S ribosomal protein L29 [Gluconobacter wancherniae]MBS1094537.1 50S ribosomal protein L29 [Gluconobacter wancherniae]
MADTYKPADLRAKSEDELNALLLDLKREQINQRFSAATGQSENTSRVKVVRRAVARIKTLAQQSKNSAGAKTSASKS